MGCTQDSTTTNTYSVEISLRSRYSTKQLAHGTALKLGKQDDLPAKENHGDHDVDGGTANEPGRSDQISLIESREARPKD